VQDELQTACIGGAVDGGYDRDRQSRTARNMRSNTSCCERHCSSLSELRSFRSAPAQNALSPVPVMTTQRYGCSARKRSKRSHSSSAAAVLKRWRPRDGRGSPGEQLPAVPAPAAWRTFPCVFASGDSIPGHRVHLADSGWPCPLQSLSRRRAFASTMLRLASASRLG